MKDCEKCGAENPEDALFCFNCGHGQGPPVEGASPGSVPPPPGYLHFTQGPYPPPAVTNNAKAIASMVLGIVGIFACPIVCSTIALILGYQARNEIAASRGYQTGESFATAGIIMGWVGLVLTIIWITIWAVVAAVSATSVLIIPMMI